MPPMPSTCRSDRVHERTSAAGGGDGPLSSVTSDTALGVRPSSSRRPSTDDDDQRPAFTERNGRFDDVDRPTAAL